jgi:hypothetical protein
MLHAACRATSGPHHGRKKAMEGIFAGYTLGQPVATGITGLQAEERERKAAAQSALDFLNLILVDHLGEPARKIDEYQHGDQRGDQLQRDFVEALGKVRERGHEEWSAAGRRHEREEADKEAAAAEGRETAVALRKQLIAAQKYGQEQKQRADKLAAIVHVSVRSSRGCAGVRARIRHTARIVI